MGVIAVLFLKQPDMGSLIVFLAIAFFTYVVAGAPWKHVLYIIGIGAACLVILMMTAPYRFDRLKVFLTASQAYLLWKLLNLPQY